MNKIFKYSMGVLLAGLTMTACSPDEFTGADPSGVPTISGVDFTPVVDQETNQMTVSYTGAQGTYPIWIIDGTSYSTLHEVGYRNTEAGTHSIALKIGNRNGISKDAVEKSFTFNETKIDWSADFKRITEKEWRFANKEEAHLGCGPAGGDGAGWWAAKADEKAGTGMYDDRITFTADNATGGTYSYNPGEDGLTYVNTGTTIWGSETADWDAEIGAQTATWHFEKGNWEDADGEVHSVTYLVLAANTVFPYISSDEQYANPRFRVESLTAKKMVLVYEKEDRSIAWRFIFTSEEGEVVFEGFKADSDFNLWKTATLGHTFWYAPGWSQIADPELTEGNNSWSFNLSTATTDRWMAQFAITSDIATNAATNYDFSVILTVSKDVTVMVKLVEADEEGAKHDDNYFFADEVSLKAGDDYIFWKSDMPGIDAHAINLVFDFGGNQDDTDVEVRNVVLKDHANDDGTVLPNVEPGGDDDQPKAVYDWNENAGGNLWKAVEDGDAFISVTPWFADDSWSQIGDPEWTHKDGVWELTIPEGIGGSQWQGQFPINTTLTASLDKKYNFYLIMEADENLNGVTIKLTETDDADGTKHDQNFFFADQHNITADEQFVYKAEAVSLSQNDAHALSLFFDFGGAPVGTKVKISKIYFEEATVLSYDDANNLWKAVDGGDAFISVTPWFADDSWSQIADPTWNHDGSKWSLTIPEGMGGSQWQGQFPINTTLATAQNDAYNFSCTILSDTDANGITIKLTETDDADGTKHDQNFYFAAQHNVTADEPYVYTVKGVTLPQNDAHALSLFFDFGGTPVGTKIEISDIIFEKAE